MSGQEIIKAIMEEQDVGVSQMARKLGISRATMWGRLNAERSGDISLSSFNAMLNVLGYEVIVKEKQREASQKEWVVD